MIKQTLFYLVAILLLSTSFVSCSKKSPTESDPTLQQQLQSALDNGLKTYHGKGISAAVIMPDGETWLGVSGVSHGTTKITSNMRFGAGSIAKNFTATTILKLVEEGELSLEDSLYEWVPAYPYVDSTISIRQLLNHTSGLYDIVDNPDVWEEIFQDPSRIWTPAEMIIAFNHEPLFPKGTDWNYSSIPGYAILRIIIQDITGLDVATAYHDRCFVPFGLSNTFASMGEPLPANTAHGWFDLDNDGDYEDFFPWPRTAFASGIPGEVFSSAEDLAKWARALFHVKSVLSQQSLEQMLTFHSPCTGEEYMVEGYGLGAVRFNPNLFNGLNAIGHSGDAPGYAAACIYLPDYEVCIGFMDNTEEGNAMWTLLDLMNIVTDYLEETVSL
jgi:D-alanyl-D-alanine carboxypeptidase